MTNQQNKQSFGFLLNEQAKEHTCEAYFKRIYREAPIYRPRAQEPVQGKQTGGATLMRMRVNKYTYLYVFKIFVDEISHDKLFYYLYTNIMISYFCHQQTQKWHLKGDTLGKKLCTFNKKYFLNVNRTLKFRLLSTIIIILKLNN